MQNYYHHAALDNDFLDAVEESLITVNLPGRHLLKQAGKPMQVYRRNKHKKEANGKHHCCTVL